MSRNTVIIIVVAILAVGGWYLNKFRTPAASETKQVSTVNVENSSSTNNSVTSTEATDAESCGKRTHLTFTPETSLVDSYTKTSFIVPRNTVSIISHEVCSFNFNGTFETTISLGEKNIYLEAAPDSDKFGEWNAGVPIKELETITIQVGGFYETATVYDVEEWLNGEWKLYGEPFLIVFEERNNLHYMFQLPFDSDESKQESLSFLSSLKFVQTEQTSQNKRNDQPLSSQATDNTLVETSDTEASEALKDKDSSLTSLQTISANVTSGNAPLAVNFSVVYMGLGDHWIEFGDNQQEEITCIAYKPETDACMTYTDKIPHTYSKPGIYTAKYMQKFYGAGENYNKVIGSLGIIVK